MKNFTHEDITKGLISYLNEHLAGNADEIAIRIRCKDAINVAQLGVWMLPSSYWDPLDVKSLRKLSVEESTSALITKKVLEVSIRCLKFNFIIIKCKYFIDFSNQCTPLYDCLSY